MESLKRTLQMNTIRNLLLSCQWTDVYTNGTFRENGVLIINHSYYTSSFIYPHDGVLIIIDHSFWSTKFHLKRKNE